MDNENEEISSFLEEILKTNISDAKIWYEAFKRGFPDILWKIFAERAVTSEAVEGIVIGISFQISRFVRRMPEGIGLRKLEEGRRFLKEIDEKARKRGIEVDLEKINSILDPSMEKIGDILLKVRR